MRAVTLTTDLGAQGYYLAVIKGALLKASPNLNIVDISHDIQNYDIVHGAFILKNAWKSFPEGTIHLVAVDNSPDGTTFIIAKKEKQYFLCPDNGILSLIFEELPVEIYRIAPYDETTFSLPKIFASTVKKIVNGIPLKQIGTPTEEIVKRITLQPVINNDSIRGSIIFVDNYENAVVNITKTIFDNVVGDRPFSLYFKRNNPILKLSKHYHEVPVGEPLCLFNSAGLLEIAINMGKASGLLGLKKGDTIELALRKVQGDD